MGAKRTASELFRIDVRLKLVCSKSYSNPPLPYPRPKYRTSASGVHVCIADRTLLYSSDLEEEKTPRQGRSFFPQSYRLCISAEEPIVRVLKKFEILEVVVFFFRKLILFKRYASILADFIFHTINFLTVSCLFHTFE